MKKNITVNQLNELSEKGKERLREWWKPKEGDWVYTTWREFGSKGEFVIFEDKTDDDGLFIDYSNEDFYPNADSISENKLLPLLSIGQMIEFLDEHNNLYAINSPQKGELNKGDLQHKNDDKFWNDRDMANPYDWQVEKNSVGSFNSKELCDALWEAVKEILEK